MKKKSGSLSKAMGMLPVTSMQFTGSYYRCYTVLRAPAILRQCFVDSLEIFILHIDSLFC